MAMSITKSARHCMPAVAIALALTFTPAVASADQDWSGGLGVPAVQDILHQATGENFGTTFASADLPDGLTWLTALPSREIGQAGFDLRPYIEGIAYFGPILRQLSALPEAEQTAITAQVFIETTGEGLSETATGLLQDMRAPEALIIAILEEAEANGADEFWDIPAYEEALLMVRETGNTGASTLRDLVVHAPQAGAMLPIWQLADAATAERDAATAERDAATAERDAATAERDAATAERDAAIRIAESLGRILNEIGLSDE
jgi:hypothetical protein